MYEMHLVHWMHYRCHYELAVTVVIKM